MKRSGYSTLGLSGGSGTGSAKRSRGFIDYKTRQVQGDVTINLTINDREPDLRRKWMQTHEKSERMGEFFDGKQVDIIPGDLVFTVRRDTKLARSKLPFDLRNTGVVAFNAFPIMGARSSDEFSRYFKFVGVSKIAYSHQDLSQPLNGISVQHRGATTVRNDGVDTFNPGDRWAAAIPSPNEQARSAELSQSGQFPGVHRQRLHARPKRVSYVDSVAVLEKIMPTLVKGPNGGAGFDKGTSLSLLRPNGKTSMSQLQEFMMCVKQTALQWAFQSAAVLAAYGLVSLQTPQYGAADAKSLDAGSLSKSLPTLLAESGSNPARRAQLKWLARKLDLWHDDSGESLEPSRHLCEAVVGVDFSSSFVSDRSARAFDVRRLLDPSADPNSLGAVRSKGAPNYSSETYAQQLAARQQRASADFYRSAIQLKLVAEEQVVGVALNFSRPREPLDVYIP